MENIEYHLLEWFQKTYPKLVSDMSNCTHHFDEQTLNPYHMEGSIWTHTLMVYNYYITNNEIDIEILLACLLHDIGKPKAATRVEDKKRVRFFQHESISFVLAIDILDTFEKDFFKINKLNVLKLINWHSDFHDIGKIENNNFIISKKQIDFIKNKYGCDPELYYKMLKLNKADNLGRITERNLSDELKFNFFRNFKFDVSDTKDLARTNSPVATILVGIPGSGKSTSIDKDVTVISFDNAIMGAYPDLSYNDAFNKAREEDILKDIEKQMFLDLRTAVKNKENIIIDKTNLTKKSRNRIISQISKDYFIEAKVFIVELPEIKKRLSLRKGKYISDEVLDSMIKNFRLPGYDEKIDSIKFLIG
jgi:predicted kinase